MGASQQADWVAEEECLHVNPSSLIDLELEHQLCAKQCPGTLHLEFLVPLLVLPGIIMIVISFPFDG